jgi:N-acetyl-gamma-glutamyl-phosphate reductase
MKRVGIVGFRGYSGAELLDLLWNHPGVEPVLLEHRSEPESKALPRGSSTFESVQLDVESLAKANLSVAMLATPHEVSNELTPMLLQLGFKVIDLSGGYRLRTNDQHKRWYGHDHPQLELLAEARYGLPEFYRDKIRGARLVANPGCYPTAANLSIRPLIQAGLVELTAGIISQDALLRSDRKLFSLRSA